MHDPPRSSVSQSVSNSNASSDHKKPRTGTDEPDQGRLKNAGGSYGKSSPNLVSTAQKRSQGVRKCSEELYETMQKSGKLELEHKMKRSSSIGISQEKLKRLAHAVR